MGQKTPMHRDMETGPARAGGIELWRDLLSGEATGPEPGEPALEPLLDLIGWREAVR